MVRRKHISKQTRTLIAVLAKDSAEWRYGYELCKSCALKSGALYPILIRLENDGLLSSRWEQSSISGRPPRHMYQLTQSGRAFAVAQANDATLPPLDLPQTIDAEGLSHA